MSHRLSFLLAGLLAALLAAPAALGQIPVVPSGLEWTEGNSTNVFPFHCDPGSYPTGLRYQQVYSGAAIGAGSLSEIHLREDLFAQTWTSTISGVTVRLSSTTKAPDGLSTTFANNFGGDTTIVFSGTLVLSNVASADMPAPFTIVVPFQHSFPFDPSGGKNLLLDVTIPTCPNGASFDAEDQPADGVSRLYGAAASSSGVTDTSGLVTQFQFQSHVFADGFESGNLSRWSLATP